MEAQTHMASISNGTAAIPIDAIDVRGLIHTVRGTQVMLDSDLARLYQVETGNLNKAAGRNKERFPDGFRFRLTLEEWSALRFQTGRAKPQSRGGRRTPPFAYSEQGVAMLSAVLKSETAVRVSVQIMQSFVEMRRFIAFDTAMFERISALELRQVEYQRETTVRIGDLESGLERVFNYMEAHEAPKQRVFFEGQVWDAFELLTSLVRRAKRSVTLVDGYVGLGTLNVLTKKREGVRVTVWTHPRTHLAAADVAAFNAQYPTLEVHHTEAFHDRFLILDETEAYLVGASLKDAGRRAFAVTRIEDEQNVRNVLARLR